MSEPDDREILLDPEQWPLGHILPMKRPQPGGWVDTGYLVQDEGWMIHRSDRTGQERYETVDELLECGWLVD